MLLSTVTPSLQSVYQQESHLVEKCVQQLDGDTLWVRTVKIVSLQHAGLLHTKDRTPGDRNQLSHFDYQFEATTTSPKGNFHNSC